MNKKLIKIITAAVGVCAAVLVIAAVNPYQPGVNVKSPTFSANNFSVLTFSGADDGVPRATNGIGTHATGVFTNLIFQPTRGADVGIWLQYRAETTNAGVGFATNVTLFFDVGASSTVMTSNQPMAQTIYLPTSATNYLVTVWTNLWRTNFSTADWLKLNHCTNRGASINITNVIFGWTR